MRTKKLPPTQDELASRWFHKNRLTAFGLGKFLRYRDGIWVPISEDEIKDEILAILIRAKQEKIRPSASLLNSVLELARIKIVVENNLWNANPDILICKNGTLFIPTEQLKNHSPKYHTTTGVPYDFDPTLQPQNFMKVLSKLEPEVVSFLQEFAGYSLTIDTQFEIALWLQGPPGSGKSTFIIGLQAMLGERSIDIGLASMERSRFALWNIPGKTLMIATESPSMSITVTDLINALISGEPVVIEQKFKDPYETIPHAKIIWAMNEPPSVSSSRNGIFRRIQIVDFPLIPLTEQDPKVKEAVKKEGAGILNWALEGHKRLYKRGAFQIPSSVQAATEEYRMSMDIPSQFLVERCILDPTVWESSNHLYAAYDAWCYLNGHKAKNSTMVAKDWKRLGLIRRRSNKGIFWMGVKLK